MKNAIELAASSRPSLPPGLGGTWTNLLRPIQNTTTDASISTPGMPNATRTPAYFQIERDREVREEAAEVDDEVERSDRSCAAGTSCLAELIADVRRDARLDPARADRDQPQARTCPRSECAPSASTGCRTRRRPTARGWCGTCPAAVGDDRADHRQRVDRRDEQMDSAPWRRPWSGAEQRVVHVQRRAPGTA